MMRRALDAARAAVAAGEVPIGAVVARDRRLVCVAHNAPLGRTDPTAHAEMLALREAARALGAPRLPGTTLYVTLEPCLMCLGAMVHARIDRLVFGAPDPKVGATRLFADRTAADLGLNHAFAIEGGLLAEESAALLRSFFRARR
ncbi:MAG: nucleoside deaminase [Acidobacteria bacterium]|nr:MAG: nucleoside deaminase [Acidobacteriota bacterium]